MATATSTRNQSNSLLDLGVGSAGVLGSVGDLLDQVGDVVEDLVGPAGGPVDDIVDGIGNVLREVDAEDGGLLSNLFSNGLLGTGSGQFDEIVNVGLLGDDGIVTLDLANTRVAILPQNDGIVTVNGEGVLGENGDLLDLGGVIGEGGLINLTGLVGEDGLIDLGGVLGSVLGLLGNGSTAPGDFVDEDGNIDPSKFEDAQWGDEGNDSFLVNPDTSTYVDGAAGTDTVNFASSREDFAFAVGEDAITFQNESDFFYFDNVERVKFFDAQLYLDTGAGENAGSAYRLYQAAFDRQPDSEGLEYWIGRLDAGVSLEAIADSFINSPEFARTYGTVDSVSNDDYVDLLYTNVLGRDYDAAGFNYWVERLDQGATNRGDLLAFFSESDENQALVAPNIDDGIWLS